MVQVTLVLSVLKKSQDGIEGSTLANKLVQPFVEKQGVNLWIVHSFLAHNMNWYNCNIYLIEQMCEIQTKSLFLSNLGQENDRLRKVTFADNFHCLAKDWKNVHEILWENMKHISLGRDLFCRVGIHLFFLDADLYTMSLQISDSYTLRSSFLQNLVSGLVKDGGKTISIKW